MKLKWGDFLIFISIALVIVLMLLLSVSSNESASLTAVISKDGQVLYEINLSDTSSQEVYLLDDGDVVIHAEHGKIKFHESDCNNQICVYTGWISNANQIAACLPNRILVKLVGISDEVDVVLQ